MGKSQKKYERIKKKNEIRKDKVEKNRLKKQIHMLLKRKKMVEAGILLNKYREKYGDIDEKKMHICKILK